MKVVKAVTIKQPLAGQIAAGEQTGAFKGFRTDYRGEILIVADEEPWYGLALADLVDVRPITPEMNAPLTRGYAWSFRNIVRITRFPTAHRAGLYTAEIPEGALPSALQSPAFSAEAPPPPESQAAIKAAVAKEIRTARAGLRVATRGLAELGAVAPPNDGEQARLRKFEATAAEILTRTEALINDMVRLDPVWRRELAPRSTDEDVIAAALGTSSVGTPWQRRRRLDVLVVEDEPKMARGVQRSLSLDHDVRIAMTKQEALAQLRDRAPDVLLCDHRLEWQKTDDLFEYVRDNHPRVRRVLYSFSNIEVWNDLIQRKLVDAAIPKSAPRNALLSALF